MTWVTYPMMETRAPYMRVYERMTTSTTSERTAITPKEILRGFKGTDAIERAVHDLESARKHFLAAGLHITARKIDQEIYTLDHVRIRTVDGLSEQ